MKDEIRWIEGRKRELLDTENRKGGI